MVTAATLPLTRPPAVNAQDGMVVSLISLKELPGPLHFNPRLPPFQKLPIIAHDGCDPAAADNHQPRHSPRRAQGAHAAGAGADQQVAGVALWQRAQSRSET